MIRFQDFAPKRTGTAKVLIFSSAIYEDFAAAAVAASEWIERNQIELVNIETVVLPNMHSQSEEGTVDGSLHTSGERHASWHQFVRVWYRFDGTSPPPVPPDVD